MYSSFSKRSSRHPSDYRRVSFSENRHHSFRSEPDGGYFRASGYGGLSTTTPHGRVPIGSYSSNGGGRGGGPGAYDDMDLIHDQRHQQQRGTIGLLAPGSVDIASPNASGY
eukprot:scaffold398750_cov86-Attheya_sp.AAC.1